MKERIWSSLPILLLLASCATTYTHPTKGVRQFEEERAVCERAAQTRLAAQGVT